MSISVSIDFRASGRLAFSPASFFWIWINLRGGSVGRFDLRRFLREAIAKSQQAIRVLLGVRNVSASHHNLILERQEPFDRRARRVQVGGLLEKLILDFQQRLRPIGRRRQIFRVSENLGLQVGQLRQPGFGRGRVDRLGDHVALDRDEPIGGVDRVVGRHVLLDELLLQSDDLIERLGGRLREFTSSGARSAEVRLAFRQYASTSVVFWHSAVSSSRIWRIDVSERRASSKTVCWPFKPRQQVVRIADLVAFADQELHVRLHRDEFLLEILHPVFHGSDDAQVHAEDGGSQDRRQKFQRIFHRHSAVVAARLLIG